MGPFGELYRALVNIYHFVAGLRMATALFIELTVVVLQGPPDGNPMADCLSQSQGQTAYTAGDGWDDD